jgi:hypothetical protein
MIRKVYISRMAEAEHGTPEPGDSIIVRITDGTHLVAEAGHSADTADGVVIAYDPESRMATVELMV